MPLARLALALACALFATPALSQGRLPGRPCPPQTIRCEVSAPAFYWGRRELTQDPVFVQGSVGLTCSKQQDTPVDLDIELQGVPGKRQREMHHDRDEVDYALFLDPSHTVPWGDGSTGTEPITESIRLGSTDHTVTRTYLLYGRLDGARLDAAIGRYVDAIVARLNYTASCR